MPSEYYRPLLQTDMARPNDAVTLASGWTWFNRVEILTRSADPVQIPAADLPVPVLKALSAPRAACAGLDWTRPNLMGIVNTTPDSFSDGGAFLATNDAVTQATRLKEEGADILDIGGESTRPGAETVDSAQEVARTQPVIAALTKAGVGPISIDTRKAVVGAAAVEAGAQMINDVAAFTYDATLADVAAKADVPVCIMHAKGQPKDMQRAPQYSDVLLDVYDFLEARIEACLAAGIARDRIVVDPGIGFGKTLEHNLTLLRGLAVFHALGCPVLLGASRKRFIGTLTNTPDAADRMPGTLAVTLQGYAQGVQLHRVHDILPAKQALDITEAVVRGRSEHD
ncbi:dihydropteroate synthase [Algirhabdus cladophorae]|uniref:dihydropteroate synthase n=1 Tax=Algirhabdus cladophorae TaxID=3377108 RepID=UPI003B849877